MLRLPRHLHVDRPCMPPCRSMSCMHACKQTACRQLTQLLPDISLVLHLHMPIHAVPALAIYPQPTTATLQQQHRVRPSAQHPPPAARPASLAASARASAPHPSLRPQWLYLQHPALRQGRLLQPSAASPSVRAAPQQLRLLRPLLLLQRQPLPHLVGLVSTGLHICTCMLMRKGRGCWLICGCIMCIYTCWCIVHLGV